MTVFREGELTFTFDMGCEVGKYDTWSFYRQSFQSAAGGSKGVDFVCVCDGVAWLIEVKNYRLYPRENPIDLCDEVAVKVRDTLAGLAAAATNAEDANERQIARLALKPDRPWRVALHLEQPGKRTKLWATVPDPSKAQQKLRQKLRFVDPDASVVDTSRSCAGMNWKSQRK